MLGGGSGPTFVSGWISAFSVFTEKGEWQGDVRSCFDEKTGQEVQTEYPCIDTDKFSSGHCVVPVLVDDNGTLYDTQMFAG